MRDGGTLMKRKGIRTAVLVTCITSLPLFGTKGWCSTIPPSKGQKEAIVAKANGCVITKTRLKEELNRLSHGRPQKMPLAFKVRLVKRLLGTCLMEMEAKKAGVQISPEDKEKMENMRRRLLIKAYIEDQIKKHPITDKEIRDYYQANKSLFTRKPLLKVRHILVKDRKTAEDILHRLRKGADFAELAAKYNVDNSKNKGGELGWIQQGTFSKGFSDAAFSLKPWEISSIVHDYRGYHIIRVEGKRKGCVIPLSQAKWNIKAILERERASVIQKGILDKYKPTINLQLLRED